MHLELLTTGSIVFLFVAIAFALAFEFVNGFHDTANAVATVIYTNTLRPWAAVIWSGLWNLIGVLTSSGGVAFAILALLPVELIVNIGSGPGFAMVFALLFAAIAWNLGTWYFGIPASSSHTLIGSILGVGLAWSLVGERGLGAGVNWAEVTKIFRSLFLSPAVGFLVAALLVSLARVFLRKRLELFRAPPKDTPPPRWVRALLILTCTGVSFAHGSNDGQKGMGLMLLVLIGILPGAFALNPSLDPTSLARIEAQARSVEPELLRRAGSTHADDPSAEVSAYLRSGNADDRTFAALAAVDHRLAERLHGRSLESLSTDERKTIRTDMYLLGASLTKLQKQKQLSPTPLARSLEGATQFIPFWVKLLVALALGLGTLVGWKRIVVTVGEKIGKGHLTYAQGAAAELTAMATILAADHFHLPVSTTHVLSSGIAGTMAANRSGLQKATVRNLLLAWVLTLPVSVLLGALTFAAAFYLVLHSLVLHTAAVLGALAVAAAITFVSRRRRRPTAAAAAA
jgi:PiT family inorganic phosphate transporter